MTEADAQTVLAQMSAAEMVETAVSCHRRRATAGTLETVVERLGTYPTSEGRCGVVVEPEPGLYRVTVPATSAFPRGMTVLVHCGGRGWVVNCKGVHGEDRELYTAAANALNAARNVQVSRGYAF